MSISAFLNESVNAFFAHSKSDCPGHQDHKLIASVAPLFRDSCFVTNCRLLHKAKEPGLMAKYT